MLFAPKFFNDMSWLVQSNDGAEQTVEGVVCQFWGVASLHLSREFLSNKPVRNPGPVLASSVGVFLRAIRANSLMICLG